jgi:molecular chaperone GrpE
MTEIHDGGDDRPEEPTGPIIRDRRRIDPLTGAVRPSAAGAVGGPAGPAPGGDEVGNGAEIVGLQAELAERTADLQRVQAEYLNYRRRVERDREAVRDLATANAVTVLFPVLDDIGRAREHGELVGGFRSVADAIEQALTKLGVVQFGQVGDPFDPTRHEALMHAYSDEVTETTCTQVFAPGYQLGDRVLRPAKVAVADPTAPFGEAAEEAPAGDPYEL